MATPASERHDGDGVLSTACRHIQAPAGSDLLSEVALLKMDGYNTSAGTRVVYTLWVDASGDWRILATEPTASELTGTTTAIGTVVGSQS